ncbi:hypothetical protein FJZ26_00200 [Candidatus Parvarchaeota archaeon]|nr:hypothetical protein [Candidatus Parvarchaeota archaeon]
MKIKVMETIFSLTRQCVPEKKAKPGTGFFEGKLLCLREGTKCRHRKDEDDDGGNAKQQVCSHIQAPEVLSRLSKESRAD